MPTRSWCWKMAAWSSGAGMASFSPAAASTPPCGPASNRQPRSRRHANWSPPDECGNVSAPGPADVPALAEAITRGDRRALARAITLVESTKSEDRPAADALLEGLLPRTGKSIRLGISGAPGVGKSTFIESFGLHVVGQGHRLAVLAVDPSSRIGGGSILGDKTRMAALSADEHAFVR